MKTFETEKGNIPDGATHHGIYGCDTDVYFKEDNGVFLQWHHENWSLSKFAHHKWVKPIPQTNVETPEEKEALDLIDTTPQQYESVASKEGEWVDGDELPPVGCEVMTSYTDGDCDGWCDFHGPSKIIAYHGDYVWVAHHGKFNQVHELSSIEFESVNKETPQQREERERLEAAYDLYVASQESLGVLGYESLQQFSDDKLQVRFWLSIVGKTNYRKER